MSFLAISAPHVRGTAPHLDAGAPAHALLALEHAHFRPPPHDLGGIVWPVHAPDPLDADSPRHPQRVPFSLVKGRAFTAAARRVSGCSCPERLEA